MMVRANISGGTQKSIEQRVVQANRPWVSIAGILLVTWLAYLPALGLQWIWDDDQYVTENALLRNWEGLYRIWFEPSASPQYYPTVFSLLWLQFQVFGLNPAVFHGINVPTPLLTADKIFVMHDDGIAQCYALASGKTIWKKRLGTASTASPIWLSGSILVCGESGAMLLADSRNGDLIDSISLSQPIFASPGMTGERLLIRTQRDLQCFRNSVAQ